MFISSSGGGRPRPAPGYAFIDGNYFYSHVSKAVSTVYGADLCLNDGQLRVLCSGSSIWETEKIFFFDSMLEPDDGKDSSDQIARLEARRAFYAQVADMPGFHIFTGTSVRRSGSRNPRIEQKEVDVLLTVKALQFASRGVVRHMALFAADRDFVPLVEALIEVGGYVKVLSFAAHAQADLFRAADEASRLQPFNMLQLHTLSDEDRSKRIDMSSAKEIRRDKGFISNIPSDDWAWATNDEGHYYLRISEKYALRSHDAATLCRFAEWQKLPFMSMP